MATNTHRWRSRGCVSNPSLIPLDSVFGFLLFLFVFLRYIYPSPWQLVSSSKVDENQCQWPGVGVGIKKKKQGKNYFPAFLLIVEVGTQSLTAKALNCYSHRAGFQVLVTTGLCEGAGK